MEALLKAQCVKLGHVWWNGGDCAWCAVRGRKLWRTSVSIQPRRTESSRLTPGRVIRVREGDFESVNLVDGPDGPNDTFPTSDVLPFQFPVFVAFFFFVVPSATKTFCGFETDGWR